MDVAAAISSARREAGLSQAALAERGGTSQATVSAYENGRKQPSVATLSRLLAAAGSRLTVQPAERPVIVDALPLRPLRKPHPTSINTEPDR